MEHKEDVIFLGRKEIGELILITGAAEAMLYTSLYEGFGIPILEGFHAEIPVITSKTTSMPEIAGDAALLVDPYSIDEITQSLVDISTNPTLKSELIQKGKQRKTDFSWDLTADLLWQTIEKEL